MEKQSTKKQSVKKEKSNTRTTGDILREHALELHELNLRIETLDNKLEEMGKIYDGIIGKLRSRLGI